MYQGAYRWVVDTQIIRTNRIPNAGIDYLTCMIHKIWLLRSGASTLRVRA